MTHVTFNVSHVTCHVSRVTCHVSLFSFFFSSSFFFDHPLPMQFILRPLVGPQVNYHLTFTFYRSDRGDSVRSRSSSSLAAVLSMDSYLNSYLLFLFAGQIEAAYKEVKELFEPCCCPLNRLLFKYLLKFFYLQFG